MHKIQFRLGIRPPLDPAVGAHNALQPPCWILVNMKGKEKGGKKRKEKEGAGRGEGEGEGIEVREEGRGKGKGEVAL